MLHRIQNQSESSSLRMVELWERLWNEIPKPEFEVE